MVPNSLTGPFTVRIYKSSSLASSELLAYWSNATPQLFYPSNMATGTAAEGLEGYPIVYDDDDSTSQLHLQITNNDTVAHTYTVTVKYDTFITASSPIITTPQFTTGIGIGGAAGTGNSITLYGTSSGTATIRTAAAAGTTTLILPATVGAANNALATDGSGNLSWSTTLALVQINVPDSTPLVINGAGNGTSTAWKYGGGVAVQIINLSGLHLAANKTVSWSNTSDDATQSNDTGLSRDIAGRVAIGNGSVGDASGTIYLARGGFGAVPDATAQINVNATNGGMIQFQVNTTTALQIGTPKVITGSGNTTDWYIYNKGGATKLYTGATPSLAATFDASQNTTLAGALVVTGNVGFFNVSAAAQQTSGANLTNNVTAGGSNDTIANFTDLTTYANDAAAIRNDIYQLSRKLKQINDGLRTLGLFT